VITMWIGTYDEDGSQPSGVIRAGDVSRFWVETLTGEVTPGVEDPFLQTFVVMAEYPRGSQLFTVSGECTDFNEAWEKLTFLVEEIRKWQHALATNLGEESTRAPVPAGDPTAS